MIHKLCPKYLYDVVPANVIVASGRSLRNAQNIRLLKYRTNRFGDSFLPSVIRQWNQLPIDIRNIETLPKFKSTLKKTLLSVDYVPPYFSHGDRFANICHTQLRLSHSRLNSHLFRVNIVPSAACTCGTPSETTEHYLLYCPLYAAPRIQLLYGIRDIVAPGVHPNLLTHLDSLYLVDLLLNGNPELGNDTNLLIFSCVQRFIVQSRRFLY